MAQTPRRSAPAKPRTAIPQLSWRAIRSPRRSCSSRVLKGLRRAGDRGSARVSSRRGPQSRGLRRPGGRLHAGHPAGGHLAVALRRTPPGARLGCREVLRRLPDRGAVVPRRAAGGGDRHPPAYGRDSAGQEAPRRDPLRRGRRGRGAVCRRQARRRPIRLRRGRVPESAKKRIAPWRCGRSSRRSRTTSPNSPLHASSSSPDVPGDITEQVVERYSAAGSRPPPSPWPTQPSPVATAMRSSPCATRSRRAPTLCRSSRPSP